MDRLVKTEPPAWLEIDLRQSARNWQVIRQHLPPGVAMGHVVKDDAYGHGALRLAEISLRHGAELLIVAGLREGLELRAAGLGAPILVLGERAPEEFAACCEQQLIPCLGTHASLAEWKQFARQHRPAGPPLAVHLKIDTGMSRYGIRWDAAEDFFRELAASPELRAEGLMSHFAMSDELDKTFARTQLARFHHALAAARAAGLNPNYLHHGNSGGFLDLSDAHFNLVRLGILPLGVYPSKVCRRLDGLAPIMSAKTRIAALKELQPGDHVGYGMRFTAAQSMRLAVLPLGYGHGYPRVRNQGHVLLRGQRAPIIGGVSMDAITVDVTAIPGAQAWDEVTLLGREGAEEITIHDLAALRNTVSYDAMTSWSARLPRKYLE